MLLNLLSQYALQFQEISETVTVTLNKGQAMTLALVLMLYLLSELMYQLSVHGLQ